MRVCRNPLCDASYGRSHAQTTSIPSVTARSALRSSLMTLKMDAISCPLRSAQSFARRTATLFLPFVCTCSSLVVGRCAPRRSTHFLCFLGCGVCCRDSSQPPDQPAIASRIDAFQLLRDQIARSEEALRQALDKLAGSYNGRLPATDSPLPQGSSTLTSSTSLNIQTAVIQVSSSIDGLTCKP